MEVDNIEFLEEVKKWPGIWNYKSDEYQNKLRRHQIWEQICGKFFEDFEQKTAGQKFELVLQLQRKWKSLRDSYMRFLFRTKKAKETGAFTAPRIYTYAPYLSFLAPISGYKIESASEDSDADVADVDIKCEETPKPNSDADVADVDINSEETPKPKPPPKKCKIKKVKVMRKIETSHETEHDEDKLFLLSLLGAFRNISDDYKLDAKMEIMEVLKKYKNSSHSSENSNFVYVETCKQSQSDYDYLDM